MDVDDAALRRIPRCVNFPGFETNPGNFVGGLLDLIAHAKPKSVIEIGCNRGVSTEAFLRHCDRVVAVDPWDGNHEREAFVEFMARCGGYPNLEIVRGRSPEALRRFGREFDLCYIDACHEYEPVRADIAACLPIVKPDGWLAGHDYPQDGVKCAIGDIATIVPMTFSEGSWLLRRAAVRAESQI